MDSSFAVLLGRYRVGAGLTQEELADRAGLSAAAVSSLERGARRFPQRRTIQVLADALELTGERRETFIEAALRRRTGPRPAESTGWRSVSPHQLPAALADFTGRADDVKLLTNVLSPQIGKRQTPIAAITGMGGIGKTALAVEVAHAVAHHYPDGQLYLDLRGYGPDDPMTANDALGRLLRALGTPADEVPLVIDEAAAKYRTAVAGRRLLIMLDNARDVSHVGSLLPGSVGSAVILTSRRAMSALPGVHYLHLDALSESDGVAFLSALVGAARVDQELDSARAVVRCCASLPLGIRMAGARLAARPEWPLSHLAERLEDERHRLDEMERDEVGVRTSFAVSIDQLLESRDDRDRAAADAFALLSLSDGPDVTVLLASRLLGVAESDAERILERLVDQHLMEPVVPGRYRFHDLLRVYARERAISTKTAADRGAAVSQVLELYIGAAWRSLGLFQPHGHRLTMADERWAAFSPTFEDAGEAVDWLDAHRHHLVAAVHQAIASEEVPSEFGVNLTIGLFGFYATRRHWLDWAQITEAALGAVTDLDPVAEGILHNDRALAVARLAEAGYGSYDEAIAHLETGVRCFQGIDDRRRESMCLTNLTLVLELANKLEEAISCGERSLALDRELGDVNGQAIASGNLGNVYGRAGDHDKQLSYLQESLDLVRRLGNEHALGDAYHLLAAAHRATGRLDEAISYLDESARIFLKAGDLLGAAEVLDELGALHLQLGVHADALRRWQEGLGLAQAHDDDGRIEARILHHLGAALAELQRYDESVEYLSSSLMFYEARNMRAAAEVRPLLEHAEALSFPQS